MGSNLFSAKNYGFKGLLLGIAIIPLFFIGLKAEFNRKGKNQNGHAISKEFHVNITGVLL